VGLEMWGCGALGPGMCDWLWGWAGAGVGWGCGGRGAEELGSCVVRGWDVALRGVGRGIGKGSGARHGID